MKPLGVVLTGTALWVLLTAGTILWISANLVTSLVTILQIL